ncbi:hypothetical protein [Sandarakinorhabdus sp. AAP62]|uniref:thermonuclease family protein n=1 Tax=Sandarakinorhabdus sp. AAP62 TaxID=1248916 RepID=UPI0002F9A609|nr:hypothetical protein [Sandarakinorhabdus sp. AAP62]
MFAGEIIAGALLGSFTCLAPVHDNASTVRCANRPEIIRLMGYDAPEMPATCQPNKACPSGDPFAAREALRGLTMGRPLACEAAGTDHMGRVLARCRVEATDLSCAMLATSYAVPSRTAGDCNCTTPVRRRAVLLQSASYAPGTLPGGLPKALPAEGQITLDLGESGPSRPQAAAPAVVMDGVALQETPWSLPIAGAIVMIGLWMAMANLALLQLAHERWPSRDRWGAPMDRLDPWLFLGLAAAGASPAAWTALWTRHAGRQGEALLPRLLNITGIQIGLAIGALWWWIAG